MKTFEVIKQELLDKARSSDACEEQYKRAYKATTIEELLSVLKDNLLWSFTHMNVNAEFLEEYFDTEILNKNHIYTQGEHTVVISNDKINIVALDKASVDIETFDNSFANIKTFGSSRVHIKAFSNSSAKVESFDNASANVKSLCNLSKIDFKVIDDNSFIRHHNEQKIYIKKNNFTIEQI